MTIITTFMGKTLYASSQSIIDRLVLNYCSDNNYMGYKATKEGFNNWLYANDLTLSPTDNEVFLD